MSRSIENRYVNSSLLLSLRNTILGPNPTFEGVSFRLGGETRTMSLLEFGWRVGLYDEEVASHEDTVRT
ncbi:hypothetical protein Tco_0455496 [Tanacetum coccineum]